MTGAQMEGGITLALEAQGGGGVVSLSKNFPPRMDLGESCEPADSLFAPVHCSGIWYVCMRGRGWTLDRDGKCVKGHRVTERV